MPSNKLKTCTECGTEYQGRRGKKYCSETCKATFNNRIARKKRKKQKGKNEVTGDIHKTLWANRKILKTLLEVERVEEITKEDLLKRNFDFNYITRFSIINNNKTHFFIYDYGYYFLERKYKDDPKVIKIFQP